MRAAKLPKPLSSNHRLEALSAHGPEQAQNSYEVVGAPFRRAGTTSSSPAVAAVKAPPIAPGATRRLLTLREFLAQYDPPHYLVDGVLQRGSLYSLTGKTGAGKTGVAARLAVLVANPVGGQKFGPYEVEPGRVLYIPAENKTDVQMRMIGLMHRMGLDRATLNMLVTGDAGKLVQRFDNELALIKRQLEAIGELSLVVVDTSPALFPGDDENCNVQSRDHAQRLRKLTELPGKPCCLALCHPAKHAATADSLIPRGGGAFIAEVDGNLSLWGHGDRLAELHWCGKFRGPDFVKITFRHETVTTPELVDHGGRALPTVVAQVVGEAKTTAAGAISEDEQLLAAMLNRPEGTLEEWAADCGWFTQGDAKRPNKSLAKRVSDRLSAAQLVTKEGRKLVITPAGETAAKRVAAQ